MSKEKTPLPVSDQAIVDKAQKEATEKAAAISKKIGKNVYPLVYFRPKTKEIFVGFISEPTRAAKMEAFDIMSSKESLTMAGELIIKTSLIKEESHEAFSSSDDQSKYDDIFMGGCIDAVGHVQVLINTLKKK